jgi:hypothetical protein
VGHNVFPGHLEPGRIEGSSAEAIPWFGCGRFSVSSVISVVDGFAVGLAVGLAIAF